MVWPETGRRGRILAALPAPPALFQCRTWEGNDYLGETATPEPTCAALQVNGIDGSAALGMGSACEIQGDFAEALRHYEKARARAPELESLQEVCDNLRERWDKMKDIGKRWT